MTTATSSAVVAPLAMIFAVNDDLVSRALDGLKPEELWHAPTDQNNAMLWIAGHVVQTRATVLKLLGEAVDTGSAFSRCTIRITSGKWRTSEKHSAIRVSSVKTFQAGARW